MQFGMKLQIATQENTMKDTDIKKLLYTHLLCIFSIILSIFIPSFFLENFSILETHLTWLCICSVSVTAVNLVLYLVLKPNVSSKRSSLSYKVTRFLKCCIYFLTSCFFFHVIFVLYGAPLIELALETFSLAVILSTFTTVPCLCLLGPNFKAWLRIFSRNGATVSQPWMVLRDAFRAHCSWGPGPGKDCVHLKGTQAGRTIGLSLHFSMISSAFLPPVW
ncbi:phosphatidylinositol-glycan biosynthesis class F protein isoform X3 [Cervus canadensis]|uniref:phosphatidylinositol-glycan biosynthesis class F protein isoform X3 n=1 Tax=Cervus canadensis TaxID=1574408 RepID=UPI001C9E888A|nr:phosphatidylinositol-glycan biosynthesis class F protein isoform X3 [Cervus canadensis]